MTSRDFDNLTQDRRSSPSPSKRSARCVGARSTASRSARLCRTPCKAANDLECDMVQWQMRRSSRIRHEFASSMTLLRPVHRCESHNSEVVACDIFATPNSLKSHVARNLKSPFSNIHAVTFKLRSNSSPTTAIASRWDRARLSNPHS